MFHGPKVIRDTQGRSSGSLWSLHLSQACLLKVCVTHSRHFVDHEHLSVQMCSYGKPQPQSHSRGVKLNPRIDEPGYPGEIDNGIDLLVDFPLLHSQDGAIQVDV